MLTPDKHILSIHEKDGVRTLNLSQKHYVIGRDQQNDIVLFSKTVSRCHARLMRISGNPSGDYYRIIDGDTAGNKSTNGITVNEQPSAMQDLKGGDRILIGKVRLTYHVLSPKTAAEPLNTDVKLQFVDDLAPSINPKATLSVENFSLESLTSLEPALEDESIPTNFFPQE